MRAGDGLQPTSKGKRVAFDGPARLVIDGPFAETKEQIAGFWMWKVKDMAEAVEWVKKCPNPMPGPSEIEIRPLYAMEDFAETLTPEVAALHARNPDRHGGCAGRPPTTSPLRSSVPPHPPRPAVPPPPHP